jgi:hypothetical protein
MVCGVDQYYYRLHGTNMSRTATFASTLANLYETRNAFDAALDGSVSGEEDKLRDLRRISRATLARTALRFAVAEYMSGPDGAAAVDGFRRFAVETDRAVAGSHAWRALARREAAGFERARRAPAFRAREAVRELENRVQWRRWRYSGV